MYGKMKQNQMRGREGEITWQRVNKRRHFSSDRRRGVNKRRQRQVALQATVLREENGVAEALVPLPLGESRPTRCSRKLKAHKLSVIAGLQIGGDHLPHWVAGDTAMRFCLLKSSRASEKKGPKIDRFGRQRKRRSSTTE
ncbi:hypothetical protein U1Q18_012696 [Sarracenia purpurea var. burkii]